MLELVKVDCGALAWQPWAVKREFRRRVECWTTFLGSTDNIFHHSVAYGKTFVPSCTNA